MTSDWSMQAATSIRAAAPLNHTPAVDVCASLDLAHRSGLHPLGLGLWLALSCCARSPRAGDNAALSPTRLDSSLDAHADPCPSSLTIRAWCMTGLGSGRTLFWPPGIARRRAAPERGAAHRPGTHGADRSPWLASWTRTTNWRAGRTVAAPGHRLEAGGEVAGAVVVGARHPRQAWDCGWLRGTFRHWRASALDGRRWWSRRAVRPRDRHRPCSTCWLLTATTATQCGCSCWRANAPGRSASRLIAASVPLSIDAPPVALAARQN